MTQLNETYNADLLDAMADMAYEQEQAMRESLQSDWSCIEQTDGIAANTLINQPTTEWSLIEVNGNFVGFQTTNEWEGIEHADDQS